MAKEIDALVRELLSKAKGLDRERRNELRKELKDSLSAIANRIDRGYMVEIHAGDLPDPEDDQEETPADEETRHAVEAILERQERLKFANLTGEPILQLPEAIDDDAAQPGARAPRKPRSPRRRPSSSS
jgi:hypothetical protein